MIRWPEALLCGVGAMRFGLRTGLKCMGSRRCEEAASTATYFLLPGAGGDSWYWHLVAPELRARGHEVLTPDLPADDDSAGLGEYTEAVVGVLGDRADLIVVAQSLAAFVAPMLCERVDVQLFILVAPMIPSPGESPGAWWAHTGQ